MSDDPMKLTNPWDIDHDRQIEPEVGKVYWMRFKGRAPFKAQITALHARVIEYREYSFAMVTHAAMRDELELVEESKWE